MLDDDEPPEFSEVNLANHVTRAYLVKLPDFLFEEFEHPARSSGDVVGRLRLPTPGAMDPPVDLENPGVGSIADPATAPRIFIDHPANASLDTPRDYALSFAGEDADIVLMSWQAQGADPAMRVDGRVVRQCQARPPLNAAYRNISRRRVAKVLDAARPTVHMDEGERRVALNKSRRVTDNTDTAAQKEAKYNKKVNARRHLDMPGEEYKLIVKKALFTAFEKTLCYSAEELSKAVDEPISKLRPIMNEILTYNKSGPFNGKYELKDEYKTTQQREQKVQELEDHRIAEIEDVKRRREEAKQNESDRAEPALKKSRFN